MTINGKSPNRFEQSTVEQIMKKDTFLKNYTVKEVQFGLVDQKKAAGFNLCLRRMMLKQMKPNSQVSHNVKG
ncbi:hypothetical protein ACVT98_26240 (plasmid) [Vibrio campbellii]